MSGERGMPTHTVYLTGHDGGKSIFLPQRSLKWGQYDDGKMPMAVAYINKNPADLNNDADLEHDRNVNNEGVGLVSNGGAVARYVDLAPGYTCMMHRTQSLDYGIVTDGEAECVLEDGTAQLMRPGDVMVQRYTVHAWRNPSQTSWARIFFVLVDCQPLSINGKLLKEDLGRGAAYVPSSDN
ncbi:hypothetical protein N8I77_000707 [Diaporthe amygdali]|uniref:Uncharacterized protein n=1 Tax=Phomopsis amygdali TaxID=1214568 RepID=A0AAD9SQ11_PHOAM|nr:hypothetical protein N8I77_000707 [Diaporthe amygdali]